MPGTPTWTAERRMFRAVTHGTDLIAWATDEHGQCFYISPQWYRLTGVDENSSEGFNWLTSVHLDDVAAVRQSYFRAIDDRLAFGAGFRVLGADGQYHLVWCTGFPKFGRHGVFEGYFGTTFVVELPTEQAVSAPVSASQKRVLSDREHDVLTLLAEGNTSETVASMLGIAVRTVEAHVTKAADRLGATNRVNTVAKAIRLNQI